MSFVVVIPARYSSSRLPGKPLADIHGKPMIEWVIERALQAGAERVIVATDDERIKRAIAHAGAEVCMTSDISIGICGYLSKVTCHVLFLCDSK